MIKKLLRLILNIQADKILHSYAGLVIFLLCFKLGTNIPNFHLLYNYILATAISLSILVGKELYDYNAQDEFCEFKDIVGGIGGIILGILLMII